MAQHVVGQEFEVTRAIMLWLPSVVVYRSASRRVHRLRTRAISRKPALSFEPIERGSTLLPKTRSGRSFAAQAWWLRSPSAVFIRHTDIHTPHSRRPWCRRARGLVRPKLPEGFHLPGSKTGKNNTLSMELSIRNLIAEHTPKKHANHVLAPPTNRTDNKTINVNFEHLS